MHANVPSGNRANRISRQPSQAVELDKCQAKGSQIINPQLPAFSSSVWCGRFTEVVRDAFGGHDVPSTLMGVTVLGYTDQLVEIEAVAAALDS